MKENKYKFTLIEIIILSMILLASFTILNSEYLFGWISHNWTFYVVLSLIPIILIAFNKIIVSVFMTAGILIGSFIGNYLGGFIRNNNIKKIIDDMSSEQVYRMHHNSGFEIWIGTIILFVLVGVFVSVLYDLNSNREK